MSVRLADLRCGCGAPAVVFDAGHEAERAPGGFAVESGRAPRGRCAACWPVTQDPRMGRAIEENESMARKRGDKLASEPVFVDEKRATVAVDVMDDDDGLSVDVAEETLTGDIRDFILETLKHEQSKRPWHERSEADQRDTVHRVEARVQSAVRQAIEIIAGAGKRSIKATLESVTVKDGIKATLLMSKSDPQRYGLVDSQGRTVLVVVADPDTFTGEREPVAIRPDQAELLGEKAMAVHSEPNGAAETPFH